MIDYEVGSVCRTFRRGMPWTPLLSLAMMISTMRCCLPALAIADVARVFLLCCCLGGRAGGRDRPPLDRGKTESAFPGLCCLLFSIQRQRFGDANASLCHVFTEGCPR